MNADTLKDTTTGADGLLLATFAKRLALKLDEDAGELYGACPSCKSELTGRIDRNLVKLVCSLGCEPRIILEAVGADDLRGSTVGASRQPAVIAEWLHRQGFQPLPMWNPLECKAGRCSAAKDGAPCSQTGKHPRIPWKQYRDGARAKLEDVQRWWATWPEANVALITGKAYGIAILDCDDPAALEALERHNATSPLAVVTGIKTADGWRGRQFVFRYPEGADIGSKAKLRVGGERLNLDVRGDGGLAAFIGSLHKSGATYEKAGEWPKKKPFAAAPLFPLHLFDADELASTKQQEAGPAVELDADTLEEAAKTARKELHRFGPAIEGKGGDIKTFIAAALLVRDYALEDATALALLLEWNATCRPPWSEAELRAKIASAKVSGKHAKGSKLVDIAEDAKFDVEDLIERALIDVKVLFEPDLIATLARWQKSNKARFAEFKQALKAAGLQTIRDIESAIKDHHQGQRKSSESGRSSSREQHEQERREHDLQTLGFARVSIEDGTNLTPILDQLEAAMLQLPEGRRVYQQARRLVHLTRSPAKIHGIKRPDGSIGIEAITKDGLRELSGIVAEWWQPEGRGEDGEYREAYVKKPPVWPAQLLLARPSWRFSALLGIVECPTLVGSGEVLEKPGFDEASGLFASFNPSDFPTIPTTPTRADALAAVETLKKPLLEFPFVEGCDMAAMLAAMLTPLARQMIDGHVPLFAMRATAPGTGKSFLADIVAIIATGRQAPRWAPSTNDEEDRKRLMSVALAGDQVILIDNVAEPLGSPALDMALTGGSIRDRILGASKIVEAPWRAVVLATGNNLQIKGDLARRIIPIDLDAVSERPEERSDFTIQDILGWTRRNRGSLVSSALTVLRAYIVAGKPKQKITAFGSFEEWSGLVRSCLVWAGEIDPCAGRHRIREASDPARDGLRSLLLSWGAFLGYGAWTLSEALESIEKAVRAGGMHNATEGEQEQGKRADELFQALGFFDRRFDGKHLNAKMVGAALRKIAKRVVDGLRMVEEGRGHGGHILWKVELVGVPVGVSGASGVSFPSRSNFRGKSEKEQKPQETPLSPAGGNFNQGVKEAPKAPKAPSPEQGQSRGEAPRTSVKADKTKRREAI